MTGHRDKEDAPVPPLTILTSPVVTAALAGREQEVVARVRETYLRHEAGETVNPDSLFLRFPDKPDSRIIALPAFLGGAAPVAGIKWISSFPANVADGRQRASAVLVLNDYETGYPFAVLESAAISAARTAASAALAARELSAAMRTDPPATVGIVGAGYIARTVAGYLEHTGTPLREVRCHDLDPASAEALVRHLDRDGPRASVASLRDTLDADLVVFATTAASPYVLAPGTFRPGQLVLHISLRDLAPEILLRANNVLDDVEHCLKAQTSPHLTEGLRGNRDFVTGTLAQVMRGEAALAADRPTIFSPFGLGVLDVAVGRMVVDRALATGQGLVVDDFFGDQSRFQPAAGGPDAPVGGRRAASA